jgi:acetate kinase
VHGGERVREPVLIDADVEAALRELTALASLLMRRAACLGLAVQSPPEVRLCAAR